MIRLFAVTLVFWAGLVPAVADKKADATYIVEKLVTKKSMATVFDVLGPLVAQSLNGAFAQGDGAKVSPKTRDWIVSQFMTEMKATFFNSMKNEYISVYMSEFTDKELAGMRVFFDTPAGKALAEKQPQVMQRSAQAGRKVGAVLGREVGRKVGTKLEVEGGALVKNAQELAILRRMFPAGN